MTNKNKAWQCLIDVAFNDKGEVPIEFVNEFRNLAKIHKLDYYCDYLRENILPEELQKDPWEWKFLEDLSKVLLEDIKVLVLKGGAVRDMDLYPLPSLRKSVDLDIFVFGLKNKEEIKEFIQNLAKIKQIQFFTDWQKELKRLNGVTITFKDKPIDIHFELFSHLDLVFGLKRKDKNLENEIVKRSVSYRGLSNIKKMSCEDFVFHNLFEYLKEFPFSNLSLILDVSLILKSSKTTLEKLEKHAKETKQFYLYKIGTYILSQFNMDIKAKNTNWFEKKLFNINKAQSPNLYGLRSLITDRFSKYLLVTNSNWFVSIFLGLLHIMKYNVIVNSIEENPFTQESISNFITKIQYTYTKVTNFLKRLCLKLAGIKFKEITDLQIEPSTKELISLKLCDMKLTFKVPKEFINSLEEVWKGFIVSDHLSQHITVEKIFKNVETERKIQMTLSRNKAYLKSYNSSYGTATLDSSGTFFACDFWDVRTFAIFLFRAMTLNRDDLLLMHAGGVKIKEDGFIFPGESSTGKSTFFKLLTKNRFSGISDDTILLKKENNIWYMYPTPFMSKKAEPITSEKVKLGGVMDLIKVCGGHEITPHNINHSLAILFNSSLSDITIDDAGFTEVKHSKKILDLSTQIKYSSQIKFSLDKEEILIKLINNWLDTPSGSYKHGEKLTNLIEFRGISMNPTFKHGNVLIVEEKWSKDLKVRDIVGFKYSLDSLPIIHRIKYIIKHRDQTTIITKGDNCTYEDNPHVFKQEDKLLKVTGKF